MIVASKVIKEIGKIERMNYTVKVQIISYNDKEPVANVQSFYKVKDEDGKEEEHFGKRPAYDYELLCQIIPMLEEAKTYLEDKV